MLLDFLFLDDGLLFFVFIVIILLVGLLDVDLVVINLLGDFFCNGGVIKGFFVVVDFFLDFVVLVMVVFFFVFGKFNIY